MSRFRAVVRSLYNKLVFVPVVFVVFGLISGFVSVRIDRLTSDDWLPAPLRTTVDSADSILSTIAGGLISAITLLLSITLVAVQLASSRFSPRTITDWIGDRTQQITIGLVLGTTVFCLMVLRETQSIEDSITISPDISVLVAVTLMVVCLIFVVRSVGHLSNRMQIGTVAFTLMEDTVDAVTRRNDEHRSGPPAIARRGGNDLATAEPRPGCTPIGAHRSGWLLSVAWDELACLGPEGSRITMAVPVGEFVLRDQPIAWLDTDADGLDADGLDELVTRDAVAQIGSERRIDTDPSYGILQMSDVALRALSPGVNDPNTACDVVSYLGVVMLAVWEHDVPDDELEVEDRVVVTRQMSHAQYLTAAFAQVVRYGIGDVVVMRSVLDAIAALEREIVRRGLPGPLAPIHDLRRRIVEAVDRSDHLPEDRRLLLEIASHGAAVTETNGCR